MLESTVVCVDNSEWMRNGDFLPTRHHAQIEAVSSICQVKTRDNPENNVALITMSNPMVLASLTTDVAKIIMRVHSIDLHEKIDLLSSLKIAYLVLRHRQGKNHKMRILAIVGSPVNLVDKELIKLGRKFRKEKINVDLIVLGQENSENINEMQKFIDLLNEKEDYKKLSHLLLLENSSSLSSSIMNSNIFKDPTSNEQTNESAMEYSVDPNIDPELALALRLSLEEQRLRENQQNQQCQSDIVENNQNNLTTNMDVYLQNKNVEEMNEDEQIAYALMMSLNNQNQETNKDEEMPAVDNKIDENIEKH